jgi:hypothetical protein
MLSSILGRNNDVEGYWAPGLLYRELASPHTVELDLLLGTATPPGAYAGVQLARYTGYFRSALLKQRINFESLQQASIFFQFNLSAVSVSTHGEPMLGEPFACTVVLRDDRGNTAAYRVQSKCHVTRPWLFSRSTRAM